MIITAKLSGLNNFSCTILWNFWAEAMSFNQKGDRSDPMETKQRSLDRLGLNHSEVMEWYFLSDHDQNPCCRLNQGINKDAEAAVRWDELLGRK